MVGTTAHGVVNTDLMAGTDNPLALRSAKFLGADGNTPTDIDNGNVVRIVERIVDGNKDMYKAQTCAVDTDLSDVCLVASPEVMYDDRYNKVLRDFYNAAGDPIRCYDLVSKGFFSCTKECFSAAAEIVKGDLVELAVGTKLKVVKTATSGSTQVGEITDIVDLGNYKLYTVSIA